MTAMSGRQIVAHIGEIERRGSDISGTAVDRIGAMGALAAAGEVLISRTLADLIAGSEFVCTDVGEYVVAGAAEPWRLFAVVPPGLSLNRWSHEAQPGCFAGRVTPGSLAWAVRPCACALARV